MNRHVPALPPLVAVLLALCACDPMAGNGTDGDGSTAAATAAGPASLAQAPQAVATRPASPLPPSTPGSTAAQAPSPPEALLQDYARALYDRDWTRAAALWNEDSGVTAAGLARRFGADGPAELTFSEGATEGAAGSLFHEAHYSLRRASGGRETGSIIARRVNDVPGAHPDELRWHLRAMIPDQPGQRAGTL